MNKQIEVNVTPEIIERLVKKFQRYVESQRKFDDIVDDHFLSDGLFNDPNSFFNTLSMFLGSQTFRNDLQSNLVLKHLGKEYDHRFDNAIAEYEEK